MIRAAAFLLVAVPALGVGHTDDAPRAAFLKAADNGDVAAMKTFVKRPVLRMLDGQMEPEKFFESISGCYLRRVYKKDAEPNDLTAAWMCSLNKQNTRSKVVIVKIGQEPGEVLLWDYYEMVSDRPAPPRTGSAFAD